MDKENIREQLLNAENKVRESDLQINNLRQQALRHECVIKAKEDTIYQLEKQIEEGKMKLKQANEDLDRYEVQLRDSEKAVADLQTIKDDIEAKVSQIYLSIEFINTQISPTHYIENILQHNNITLTTITILYL